ncbi:DUF1758 domain-containing protein, partial [Trichonephila clavata]
QFSDTLQQEPQIPSRKINFYGFISEIQNIDDNVHKFCGIETINEDINPLSKEDGTTAIKLIVIKSCVAPTKVIPIPRLELSACLLLSQLVEKVRLSLQVHFAKVILHTDSTTVISWINFLANQLKSFVSNRVSKIHTLTENLEWKHIPLALSSADIISGGVNPEEL